MSVLQWFTPKVRYAVLLLAGTALVGTACSPDENLQYMGIYRVRVDDVVVADTIASGDYLVATLTGRPEIGDCFRFASAEIQNDSTHSDITIRAHADRWTGAGPPPPCGTVSYEYTRSPPFRVGWFELRVLQPDDSMRVDSVRVVP